MDSLPEQHIESLPGATRQEVYKRIGLLCRLRALNSDDSEDTKIAEHVARLMRDERLAANIYNTSELRFYPQRPELVVDNTGVGRAVTDLLKTKGLRFKAVTITAGGARPLCQWLMARA